MSDEAGEITYVVIDDEPAYRGRVLRGAEDARVRELTSYPTVDAFLSLQREPVDVVVLDLCLNRSSGDAAVLQGVLAVRTLTAAGHRVVIHTADERPEPVARCVAAGAAAYVSKYAPLDLAPVIAEVGRFGTTVTPLFDAAVRELVAQAWDVRLSAPVEETLRLLGRGLSDAEVARRRNLSVRTVEDHKRKILEELGVWMEGEGLGFEGVTRRLGLAEGDLVNDAPGGRPQRGVLRQLLGRRGGAPRQRRK